MPLKKKYKIAAWILCTPVVLFLLLCVLIYIPPVQRFLVNRATAYASEALEMDVHIGRVSLSFPLDLELHDIRVVKEKDTLLNARSVTADVQLLPLLDGNVNIDGLTIERADLHTADMIKGIEVKGHIGQFDLVSHGVSLSKKTVVLDNVTLSDTRLFVAYADTAAVDTTKSEPLDWKIRTQELELKNIALTLALPLDTMRIASGIEQVTLRNADLDLSTTTLTAEKLLMNVARLDYHANADTPLAQGFDVGHIRLRDIVTAIDSIHYSPHKTMLSLRSLQMAEHSGIRINDGKAYVYMDSLGVRIADAELRTDDSRLNMVADIGLNKHLPTAEQTLAATLLAEIGQDDLLLLQPELKKTLPPRRPTAPLRFRLVANGNMQHLRIPVLSASIQGALDIKGDGEFYHLQDSLHRRGQLNYNTRIGNMAFLEPLLGGVRLPQGMRINGNVGVNGNEVTTDMLLHEAEGKATLQATYHLKKEAYDIALNTERLNIDHFLPGDSLYYLTAAATAKGRGLDFLAAPTGMQTHLDIRSFLYGSKEISGVTLDAQLTKHRLTGDLQARNNYMDITGRIDAQLTKAETKGNIRLEVNKLDWHALHIMETPFSTSQQLTFDFLTDMKSEYYLTGDMTAIRLITPEKTYPAKDIHVGLGTQKDSTQCFAYAGDLAFVFATEGSLEDLGKKLNALSVEFAKQWEAKHIDQPKLLSLFPSAEINILSGKDNPLYNFLATKHLYFDDINIELSSHPQRGLNGHAEIVGLHTDSLWVDSIRFYAQSEKEKMLLRGGVKASPHPKQEAFEVKMNGEIAAKDAFLRLQYLNGKGETGADIGVKALLLQEGISFHLLSDKPTLVYRTFQANDDNYVFLGNDGKVEAQLKLHDANYSGIEFYSTPNETALQDVTLALHRINIGEFRRILPYMPDVSGIINGDIHYVLEDKEPHISTEINIKSLAYNKENMGDWSMSGVYLPKETGEHRIDGFITRNNVEVAYLNGSYFAPLTPSSKPGMSADLTLTACPLEMVNPFVPERYAVLSGGLNGTLTIAGATDRLLVNGDLGLDKVDMRIPKLSMHLRFDNRPVTITDSKVTFDHYNIYSQGKEPFVIDGTMDIRDFATPSLNLHLSAEDFELINAKKSRDAMVYGKIFVDFNSTLRGSINDLDMRGSLSVLGTSDFTYVMDNTPLTVEDRLGETVKFVSFADTTQTNKPVQEFVLPSTIAIMMNIQIDDAVQCRAYLNPSGSNYLLVEGGGNLTFQYTKEGNMRLNGRYNLNSGEMKYDLPVIPLKTFHIVNGSYLQWTGNAMNPTLSIKAYERVRASVASNGQNSRMVAFNVGVNITQNLENMGFTFTLEAPEDGAMQNELAGKTAEEKNKLAVTLLATGMYMSDTNTASGGLTASSALNAFLQSEINNIAGSALKTVDLNFDMDSSDLDGDGNSETNYNFQFAKRFWNNKVRVVIGGRVTTGNNVQQESFINNISLEYRLDNGGTRYVKLFHNKNYESILDGEVTETGVGLVLKKRVSRLEELFIFRSKKKTNNTTSHEKKE